MTKLFSSLKDSHITTIDKKGDAKYFVVCSCGWKSSELKDRKTCMAATIVHRGNKKVQDIP